MTKKKREKMSKEETILKEKLIESAIKIEEVVPDKNKLHFIRHSMLRATLLNDEETLAQYCIFYSGSIMSIADVFDTQISRELKEIANSLLSLVKGEEFIKNEKYEKQIHERIHGTPYKQYAYLIGLLDTKQKPPKLESIRIFGEECPTLKASIWPFVILKIKERTYTEAVETIQKIVIESPPPLYEWIKDSFVSEW
jgi:hypothetical protein